MINQRQLVFVDTSAFYAIKDLDDDHHREAVTFVTNFTGRFITTNFIVDETITLALHKLGYKAARELGEELWTQKYASIAHVSKADQRAAWKLFKKHDDKEFSFTDCTSFVVMERLGLLYAFAFDEHFEQTGQFTRVPRL